MKNFTESRALYSLRIAPPMRGGCLALFCRCVRVSNAKKCVVEGWSRNFPPCAFRCENHVLARSIADSVTAFAIRAMFD